MIRFIAEHKDNQVAGPDGGAGLRWGVEPMCAVLSEHGVPISPSTYYEWIARTPTRRQARDAELVEIITAAREDKKKGRFVQTLGSRKLWIWLRGQGHDVARCTVERIMREQGWEGARYGSKHKTTIADDSHVRYPDLVDRRFYACAPNRLWVADFTYVATWMGFVYVAFVIDAYSRRIVGWRAARSITTNLVLDAIEHAFFTRAQDGTTSLQGLIAHSDAGSQYTSVAFTQRLIDEGVDPSVGSVGDALDKGLASWCTSCCGLGVNSFSQGAALSGGEAGVTGGGWFVELFILVVCLVGVEDSGLGPVLDGAGVHSEALREFGCGE